MLDLDLLGLEIAEDVKSQNYGLYKIIIWPLLYYYVNFGLFPFLYLATTIIEFGYKLRDIIM